MEFIINYKVRLERVNPDGSFADYKVIEHHSHVTANNAVDGLMRAFEGCPQHTRNRIFDISITENKGE